MGTEGRCYFTSSTSNSTFNFQKGIQSSIHCRRNYIEYQCFKYCVKRVKLFFIYFYFEKELFMFKKQSFKNESKPMYTDFKSFLKRCVTSTKRILCLYNFSFIFCNLWTNYLSILTYISYNKFPIPFFFSLPQLEGKGKF